MTYISSQAFSGRGSKTLFNGVALPEVKHIEFGFATSDFSEYPRPQLTILMNYIWADKVQASLLGRGVLHGPHDVEIELPFGRKVTFFGTYIDSSLVGVSVDKEVTLKTVFVHGRVENSEVVPKAHNVEDGPEVDVIKRELAIQDEQLEVIRRVIQRIFDAAKREQEIRDYETWRNIFTLGTDAYDFEDVGTPYPAGGGFTRVHYAWDMQGISGTNHYTSDAEPESWSNFSTLPWTDWPEEYRRAYLARLYGRSFKL